MGVFHQDTSCRFHATDPPAHISQQNNIAFQTFHGEIFMQRADNRPFGLGDHGIKRRFWDSAAIHNGNHARAATGLQPLVHAIAKEIGAEASAL